MLRQISEEELKMDFYNHLNYSVGNEDWNVEEQALRIQPKDRAIVVTASGDRALHLLMTECAEVISIDLNQTQNFLLELKLAAITQLDYEKYLAFIGCTHSSHRESIFNQIKSSLSPEAIEHWGNNKKMIHKGIIYQGKTERITHYTGKLFNLLRSKKITTLFSFDNLEEQREFIAKKWDTKFCKKIFEIVINPKYLKYITKDPGFKSYTDFSPNPGMYVYQKMLQYLNNHLAKRSPLLQLVFLGKILPEAYFPYLTLDGYNKIRRDTSRLKIQTTNIVNYLNEEIVNEIDCFSLSDIASYMPQDAFENLLHGIHNAAKHNARFCLREFMSKRSIPEDLTKHFSRDTDLEQKLEIAEPNFVYRFMVGNVIKN